MLFSSGIGTYLRNVLPRVVHIMQETVDIELTVLCRTLEQDACRALLDRCRNVTTIPSDAAIYGIAEQRAFVTAIPRNSDLVWSPHYNIPALWFGKLVVTVHDTFHLAMPEFVTGVHRRWYAKLMFHLLAAKASRVICVSRFTARELSEHVRIAGEKVRVIHNGVGESWFAVNDRGDPSRRPYYLYVGNVKPHKNLGRLLSGFALIKDQVPHDLVIVGKKEGFITGDTRVDAAASALGDRVVFTGEVSDETLKSWVASAEALVFPSLYEGFGLPPLEAMAAGCPAIVSNAASLPEICGDAVLYCDPRNSSDIAEKMLAVSRDRLLRARLCALGREHARDFSWDRAAQQTAVVLQEVLTA